MTNISEGRHGSRNSVARRGASDAFPNADTHRGIEASRLVYTRSYIESLALQKTKKASTARCPNLDVLHYIKHQCAVQIRTIAHKMKACTHRRQQIRTRGRMHAMPQPAMRVAIDVHASAESQENTCPWNARWG